MRPSTIAVGATFLGSAFVVGPAVAIWLSRACDWPRWNVPAGSIIGGTLILAALVIAAYCSNLFSRIGQGTPVPVEPPTRLVAAGLYQYSRNPMYVAHVSLLLGLFFVRGDLALLVYACLYAGIIHAWVVWHEEPELLQRFGEGYRRYTKEVPRWLASTHRTVR